MSKTAIKLPKNTRLFPEFLSHSGTQHKNSKLNDEKVRWIRRMYPKKRTPEIAKILGVSDETIRRIIHRKVWKHI